MAGGTRFFDRPRGRFFGVKDERRRIDSGMESYQQVFGTEVLWFFFDSETSVVDDVYDEGDVTGGKRYDGPVRMPVLSAVPNQAGENTDDQGYATYDAVTLRLSYEQARRAGLSPNLVGYREVSQLDRFVYRDRVFDVRTIQTSGHFEQTSSDTVIAVTGVQLRGDQLVDSPDFQRWSA